MAHVSGGRYAATEGLMPVERSEATWLSNKLAYCNILIPTMVIKLHVTLSSAGRDMFENYCCLN